jgi:hypothetical protein
MNRKQPLAAGAATGAASLADAESAAAKNSGQGAVGSWFGTVTATNPPLSSFASLLSILEGGVVAESRRYYVVPLPPFPELLETTGHGAWKRTGKRSYEIFFRFLLQQPPVSAGAPIGTDNIRLLLDYDAAADTLGGTFVSQVKDNANNILIQVEGTYTATRISV